VLRAADAARGEAQGSRGKSLELLRQFRAGDVSGSGDALWRLVTTKGEDDDRAPTRAAAMFVAHALLDLQQLTRDVRAVVKALSQKK
jgi:hypothetical protein